MKFLVILLAFVSFNAFAKPVNINSADAKTLAESISGIGMKKAEDIVKYRTTTDPFKIKEDLMKVKGIGEKIVQKNSADILLSDSASKPIKKSDKNSKSK